MVLFLGMATLQIISGLANAASAAYSLECTAWGIVWCCATIGIWIVSSTVMGFLQRRAFLKFLVIFWGSMIVLAGCCVLYHYCTQGFDMPWGENLFLVLWFVITTGWYPLQYLLSLVSLWGALVSVVLIAMANVSVYLLSQLIGRTRSRQPAHDSDQSSSGSTVGR